MVVRHGPDPSEACAGGHVVADMQGSLLYQGGRDDAASSVQLRLNDDAAGIAVGIGLELQNICRQKNHIEKGIDSLSGMGGYRNHDR